MAKMNQNLEPIQPIDRQDLLWKAIALEGGMLAVGWFWANMIGFEFLGQFNISWTTTGIGLLATVPMLIALYWFGRSQWEPMARLRELTKRLIRPMFANSTIADIAIISVLAGLGEEALFRAAFQPWVDSLFGITAAVIIVSVVFGLVHYISFAYAVYATIIGAYLSMLLIVTDSLWVPIVVHAVYDFIGLYYIVKIHKGPDMEAASSE
jgi:hypothetical protein